jgi:acyl carrier protein
VTTIDKVHTVLRTFQSDSNIVFGDETELLQSGILDSFALFQLAIWIEKETESKIDPTEIDLAKEWGTVKSIAKFVEQKRLNRNDR